MQQPPPTVPLSTSNSLTEPSTSDSASLPGLLEVARIGKAHGLRGEVSVRMISDRTERVAAGAVLQTARGPMTVVRSRPHGDRWIVLFEGFEDRSGAETLHGVVLSAEAIDDGDALFVHTLIGCRVVDAAGVDRGTVEAVQANPASDLLVLEGGALVPLNFVVGDVEGGIIRVDTPDGLFELFD